MNTTIQKWGNSLALRIPMLFAKNIRLHRGSVVQVVLAEGKIEIRPKNVRKKYVLSDMLKKINRENLHSEPDWGIVGREVI